ncbi:MAG TPA: epoxide hydrolase [Ideonella sp.]|nr:epoxide hydrolase [Ideonella sp.]
MTPQSFTLHASDADLADLHERLARTRYPDRAPGEAWVWGTDPDWLRELVAYWRERFDWRAQEARLNAWPNFRVRMAAFDGLPLHFLHVSGKGPRPLPLLLAHGWPGSVFEFLELIPLLTDPAAHGGDAADAFTVVAPSLPGYGLSFEPGQRRFSVEEMAEVLVALMVDVLGFERFGTQGGDWGAFVTSRLALVHPGRVVGLHLNLLPLRRDPKLAAESAAEAAYVEQLRRWLKDETGYQAIQGTRPQTLAAALADSPAGLAAWIGEKFRAWSDCDGVVERAIDRDTMLANISLYWFSGAIGSSFWPYYARMHGPWPIPDGRTVDVPAGYAEFPREILRPPRVLAERMFSDIRRWSVMPRGGHFAALEQPAALAEEIRAFFAPLRGR